MTPITTPTMATRELDSHSRHTSLPPGSISSTDILQLTPTTPWRSARMSMPAGTALPRTLPPAGPLPLPPLTNGRQRASVTFAATTEHPDRTRPGDNDALQRSHSAAKLASDVPERPLTVLANGAHRRKRVSLRIRFSKSSPPADADADIQISQRDQDKEPRSPSWERGVSFISPDTPNDELQSFMQHWSASPMPSPNMQDLFTVPPMMPGDHFSRPGRALAPPPPPLFPAPEQPKHQNVLQPNQLFSNVLAANGRARASSVSTLDVEPPEPRSLSPPPPRRPERKRASTVSAHSKRGSIGSATGFRRANDQTRSSAESAAAILETASPIIPQGAAVTQAATPPADPAVCKDDPPAPAPLDGQPIVKDESSPPRISMEGDIIL